MSHITTCPKCGTCYEESSEETANDPSRMCWPCYAASKRKDINPAEFDEGVTDEEFFAAEDPNPPEPNE